MWVDTILCYWNYLPWLLLIIVDLYSLLMKCFTVGLQLDLCLRVAYNI